MFLNGCLQYVKLLVFPGLQIIKSGQQAYKDKKRSGAEDREITNVSDHTSINNLGHYDPTPTFKRKREMNAAILGFSPIASLKEVEQHCI